VNLSQALQQSIYVLKSNGVEDYYIEARMLLGHVTNLSPARIFTEPDYSLRRKDKDNLKKLIERRLKHEPAAYIMQRKEFYGLDFYVDPRVLIPRPETEILVDAALDFATSRSRYPSRPLLVADIGTGCGAIAISLALNLPGSKVYAIDLSSAAVKVARLNCRRHKVTEQVSLLQGDLLNPLPEPVDLIIANLPYIKTSELSNLCPEISDFEPMMALDGGENGLDFIERLLRQMNDKMKARSCLILEIGNDHEEAIRGLIHSYIKSTSFRFVTDLNGIKRAVIIDL
jgi:release factor glutamine methyltransferase